MDLRAADHGQSALHDIAVYYVVVQVLSYIPYDKVSISRLVWACPNSEAARFSWSLPTARYARDPLPREFLVAAHPHHPG